MTPLAALLAALEAKAGTPMRHRVKTTSWHSATFAGERHELLLTFANSQAASALLDGLDDHDFDLKGCFLADIRGEHLSGVGSNACVRLEALTLALD